MPDVSQPSHGEVYFLSHGGPPTMFDTESEPYTAWQKYGKMVEEARPRGLVVVSAHWENPEYTKSVLVNEDVANPLVYDFYNFPKHYYEQTFYSKGDPTMLQSIKDSLTSAGLGVKTKKRGLDHGIFVPFIVAFKGQTDIPIVQVSLPGDGNPLSAAKLGQALSSLRKQGFAIMGTGQTVHNIRDFIGGRRMPYTAPFTSALHSAISSTKALDSTLNLFRHPLYKQAHPTPEHLLPLVVSVAATSQDDTFETIFESADKLGWGMYRWKQQE